MYPRKIIKIIKEYLEKKEIIILLWPRQVWKTTIMKYFFSNIQDQKIRFDLDKISNSDIFSSVENVLSYLKINHIDVQKKVYIFIDEFQYSKNSEIIMKNIYDQYDNIKIIASGSSSMNIKDKIRESLAWRKKIFYIYSLDLEEFISWKLILKWKIKNLIDFAIFKDIKWNLQKINIEYLDYLKEYMVYWWYPASVIEQNNKKEILDNIFDLYLKKDIIDYLNIKNITWFSKLVTYLAINNWSQLNYSNLSNFSNLDINTTKSYLHILEETFIIKQIRPYYTNKNKEILKQPKVYFLDNWVRNYFIKNFLLNLDLRQDKWELFEWVVLQEFIKNNIGDIKYWRTKSWVEVDFIIDKICSVDIFEVKFQNKIKNNDFSWLLSFQKIYNKNISNITLISKYRDKTYKNIKTKSIFDLLNY